jgi:hypothetical protein
MDRAWVQEVEAVAEKWNYAVVSIAPKLTAPSGLSRAVRYQWSVPV